MEKLIGCAKSGTAIAYRAFRLGSRGGRWVKKPGRGRPPFGKEGLAKFGVGLRTGIVF